MLMYRRSARGLEVLLVHPGGPFFRGRDAGVWSVPKGEHAAGEDALACARREFAEETGQPTPAAELIDLGEIRQAGGKIVTAWAVAGNLDADQVKSNTFVLEWPPRSGREQEFPEVDRAGWFGLSEAAEKIVAGQRPLLERLAGALVEVAEGGGPGPAPGRGMRSAEDGPGGGR